MRKLTALLTYDIPVVSFSTRLYHNIISIDVGALDRGNVDNITDWGIYSNTGTITFVDAEVESVSPPKKISQLLQLTSRNLKKWKVEIFVSNEIEDLLIATMRVGDFSYNENTQIIELQLVDGIEALQTQPFARYYPSFATYADTLTKHILTESIGIAEADWKSRLPQETLEWLDEIAVYCVDIQENNVWSALKQVCELAMVRVFSDKQGEVYITHDDYVKNTNPIIIRSRNILSQPQKIPRAKTRVVNPYVQLTNRTKFNNARLDLITFKLNSLVVANDFKTFEPVSPDAPENSDITLTTETTEWTESTGTQKVQIRANVSGQLKLHQNTHSYKDPIIALNWSQTAIDRDQYKITYTNSTKRTDLDDEDENKYTPSTISTTYNSETNTIDVSFAEDKSVFYENDVVAKFVREWFYTEGSIELKGYYYEDIPDDNSAKEGFRLASNSLMQTKNGVVDKGEYGKWYIDTVGNRFGNGLVCCELECGVSDYYDETGNLVKNANDSTQPLSVFEKYEIVEPYVTRQGAEVPLATDDDGNAMQFRIIGIKYHYAGLIRQTLYLQEYRN